MRWGALVVRVGFAVPFAVAFAVALSGACSSEPGGGADAVVDAGGGGDAESDAGGLPEDPAVRINEIVAKAGPNAASNPTGSDWAELVNRTSAAVDLGGWRIIDSKSKPFAEAIPLPAGTTLPAKGHLVIWFNHDGAGKPVISKGLGASEALSLFSPDGVLQDRVDWKQGDAPEGQSWGRSPDGGTSFQTFTTPTLGAANP